MAPSFSRLYRLAAVGVALLSFASCRGRVPTLASHVPTTSTTRVANLHAFARLYGVVRWFHPSDMASAVDWAQFAIDGVRSVLTAPDADGLRSALDRLFRPIAPTVRIAKAGEAFAREPQLAAPALAGLPIVAWQHEGYGDSAVASGYVSKRLHRDREVAIEGTPFAMLAQSIDATPFRGSRVRLRGKLRAANHGRARLWLRVDSGRRRSFYDSMAQRPVVRRDWADAEIVGTVDDTATSIAFGELLSESGTAWFDDIELSRQTSDGGWEPIKIANGGFEDRDLLASWHPGNGQADQDHVNDGWSTIPVRDQPASGEACLRIQRATEVLTKELFTDAPAVGEAVEVALGGGLRARVPIALYSRNGRTVDAERPVVSDPPRGGEDAPTGAFDVAAGVADVIVVWNVLQHFWPYWDVVSVDWSAALDTALARALGDHTIDDHAATLRRLSALAPDAHASTVCPGETRRGFPPFIVDLVEGEIVVTASATDQIARGDVITAVNGRSARTHLDAESTLVSGSPQWRREIALDQFARAPTGTSLSVEGRRQGVPFRASVQAMEHGVTVEAPYPPIKQFDDGVYYVDLDRASMNSLDAIIDRLAAAPGVVFDVRIGPNANFQILSNLLTRPDDANSWLAIARMTRPDHAPPLSWHTNGWNLPVRQPHIRGRVAFLTGGRARSAAESVLGIVEHYHLGEIVGTTTAGTNGDIAQISEPTGCTTRFTGRRVTKLDGSRLYLIGIPPTIPASRTLAGVVAGRDEVLDKALMYVRTGAK